MKKTFALILAIILTTSCSSNKKANEAVTSKVTENNQEASNEIKMFSVSEAEIKKSETQAYVIYFDTNSDAITAEAAKVLEEKVLPEAKNAKSKKVVIEAHCDERGSKAYNQKLSEKRAAAVKAFLVKNGTKIKIKTKGYGESKPVALGHDEASWAKNRRAVTVVIKK